MKSQNPENLVRMFNMKSENSEFLKKKRKGRILTFLRILHFENYVFVLFVCLLACFVFLDFMNPHPWRKNSEFSECKILKNLFFLNLKILTSYFFLFVFWEKATFWFALHNDYSLKQTGPPKNLSPQTTKAHQATILSP